MYSNWVMSHYFIPSYNFLEIKLTRNAKTELLQLYDIVIQSDMTILAQCASLSDVWSQFLQGKNRSQLAIIANRICQNEEQIMRIMDRLLLMISEPSFRRFVFLKKMLFALDAVVNIEETRTYLPLFAIKRICQLMTIEKVYNLHQKNKYRYNGIKYLDKNVNGTDIASSKLWLATFWLKHGEYRRSLQNINDVLSAIPPYALYLSGANIRTSINSILLYSDIYCNNSDVTNRAGEAWLFDLNMTKRIMILCLVQFKLSYGPTIPTSESLYLH